MMYLAVSYDHRVVDGKGRPFLVLGKVCGKSTRLLFKGRRAPQQSCLPRNRGTKNRLSTRSLFSPLARVKHDRKLAAKPPRIQRRQAQRDPWRTRRAHQVSNDESQNQTGCGNSHQRWQ